MQGGQVKLTTILLSGIVDVGDPPSAQSGGIAGGETAVKPSDAPLSATQFLHFVELDEFQQDWERLGLDVEFDLLALQIELMRNPLAGDVVAGTGGLRKLGFAPPRRKSGKRGAIRVAYAHFPAHWLILLVMAYGKSRKTDLTPNEKRAIRQYLERVNRWLSQRRDQDRG